MSSTEDATTHTEQLSRGLGFWQATAINVTQIVGAGVFATVPLLLVEIPGPYALLAWLVAGILIFFDGMIWAELGAAMPSAGGSYHFLLEGFGRQKWGRLMAFLFIWQILISGPLEVGSGLVAAAQFSTYASPGFNKFNAEHTYKAELVITGDQKLGVAVSPSRLLGFGLGMVVLVLLYRSVTALGRLSLIFFFGLLAIIGWVLFEGIRGFDPHVAFDTSAVPPDWNQGLASKLGAGMSLCLYSYLGYYNICYMGGEVKAPARTIPASIMASVAIVVVLFVLIHLAIVGTIPWTEGRHLTDNIIADFMNRVHGPFAASLASLLLVGSCFLSVFSGTMGFSRVPYAAAKNGHFFQWFAELHPKHRIPHRALVLFGVLMLAASFLSLDVMIRALIATRILEQFLAQVVAVVLLRKLQPDRPRPWKMWFYPLPCLVALVGWIFVYATTGPIFILLGAGTLVAGLLVFLVWSAVQGTWPIGSATQET